MKVKFSPTPKQKQFLENIDRRLLFSGAVGAGKSVAICEKLYLMCQLYPGNRVLLVRKEYSSLRASTMLTLLQGDNKNPPVIPKSHILEHKHGGPIIIKTTGRPSEFWYTGLDKTATADYPTKIGSTQFGAIGIDEVVETEENDWLFLESRLRHPVPFHQIFGATNPGSPSHYLYKMFFQQMKGTVINSTPYDNPHLQPEYINRLEELYTGLMRDRLLKGLWVAAEGMVYENFNPEIHVKDEFFFTDKVFKNIYIGADSGFTNPRALVVAGVDSDGRIYIIDEFYRTRTSIEDAVNWIKSKGYKIERMFHDPSEPEEIEWCNKNGVIAEKAINDIIPGISKVAERFNLAGDGKPRIFINRRCINLITELQSYRYPKERNGIVKDVPLKENDHLADGLRYLVMGLDKVKPASMLFMETNKIFRGYAPNLTNEGSPSGFHRMP